ncbi:hypothetical protein [Candidatus Nitrotoga sp. BS]|uniref:hypothetical protein n=1 Tax=Candidatus Nitrotoga sp. BS TaxID=2890408 RepID=UPI001EF32314|nr:hypothetical protein [Candidatus Nitrotoga sp. BS]
MTRTSSFTLAAWRAVRGTQCAQHLASNRPRLLLESGLANTPQLDGQHQSSAQYPCIPSAVSKSILLCI